MAFDFLLVYEPNSLLGLKRRFLVSPLQLSKYITEKNANKAITAAKKQKLYKSTLKFRKYGKIDIYLK